MTSVANETTISSGTLLIEKYRVIREIGRGGMAAVYEAEHLGLQKRVAIKVLAAELISSKIVSERFFREARAAASVRSPHIVDVYDTGRLDDGRPFIVMELLEGESLYDRMARVRLMSLEDVVRIIGDCSRGLAKAHAVGIVHRDLKPENIFVLRNENGLEYAKILDFGLAKFYAPTQTDDKAARLTREGAVFGTPAYMSPEQVNGQRTVDLRSDLWALGCMTFECLTGRPVWNTEQGVAMTFAAIATEALPIPSDFRPDLPAAFDGWFRKALTRDPSGRFQSAKELSEALAVALDIQPKSSDRGTVSSPIRNVVSSSFHPLPEDLKQVQSVFPLGDGEWSNSESSKLDSSSESSSLRSPSERAIQVDLNATVSSRSINKEKSFSLSRVLIIITIGFISGAGAYMLARRSKGEKTEELRADAMIPKLETSIPTPTAPTASSSTFLPNSAPSVADYPPENEPKWASAIGEGQTALVAGDASRAAQKFKEAYTLGAGPVAKVFLSQLKAASSGRGTCRLGYFAHPRRNEKANALGPRLTPRHDGVIFSWTDDHEQPGVEHVYSVFLDKNGKTISSVRDLTPEAKHASHPSLLSLPDSEQTVLVYNDTSGQEAGVHVRLLDSRGRIAGENFLIAKTNIGSTSASMIKLPENLLLVWEDERDGNSDLFARKMSSDLALVGNDIRLTDYVPNRGHVANVKAPSMAFSKDNLYMVYLLERESNHDVMRMQIPLGPTFTNIEQGLEEKRDPSRADREFGETLRLSRASAEDLSIACSDEACFLVWQEKGGKGAASNGSFAAMFDPATGKMMWRKQFSKTGTRATLATSVTNRTVAIVFVENKSMKMAYLSRDGVSTSSNFSEVISGQVKPHLVSGPAIGEWYVTWSDTEGNHQEPYLAKVLCLR